MVLAAVLFSIAGKGHDESVAKDASASIINGSPTTVSKWPWQVAMALNPYRFTGTPRQRTFCGGVVLAPRLVLTARHCVSSGYSRWTRNMVVYSGRTTLNNSWAGTMSHIRRVIRPLNRDWDVALVRLWQPVWGQAIKLASSSEYDTWSAGQVAYSTGWGVTKHDGPMSRRLRVSKQVIFPDGVCRRERVLGKYFRPRLSLCHGSPTAKGGTCNGDSGGPLVVPVRTGHGRRYRLAGLTFYGNEYCWQDLPSVASRVSGNRLRSWIVRNTERITSAEILGAGASPESAPNWCRVPDLEGLRAFKARTELRRNGCYGARFEYDNWVVAPKNRVWKTVPDFGWLLYPWAIFDVHIAK